MNILKKLFSKSKSTFLSSLKLEERVAISNLNPLVYSCIIMEKNGECTTNIIIDDESLLESLRKLSVNELEILNQSVQLSKKGDNESNLLEQIQLYRKACELNPYNDLALMSYGCGLANQGNLREGIKWVGKAVKINPKNDRARRNLQGMKSNL